MTTTPHPPQVGVDHDLPADAVRVLSAWQPPDTEQAAFRADFLQHLQQHPDGVYRESLPDHLTASAIVLDPVRERVLLTLHAKARLWLQMGGHCERQDRTVAAAALREATEESGIDTLVLLSERPALLHRHDAPCRPGVARYHLDLQYVALAPPGAVESISAESLDLHWFGYDALPELTDASVRHLVRTAVRLCAGDGATG